MSLEEKSERLWYTVEVTLIPSAREALEYALMEAGALGTVVSDESDDFVHVNAYFDSVPNKEHVRAAMAEALRIYDLPSSSVRATDVHRVADQDWLGEWKKGWQPVRVGERFLITPPWTDISDTEGRTCIRIEPGMAFGTGTHETTRLCLSAIEKYFRGGSFLDVGTGTGILAIASAKLFPDARIEACDTDPEALAIACENARLNDVAERITFRVGSVDETTAFSDLVCANLTADVIVSLLPALNNVACGRLILSGILDSQVELVASRLHELGLIEPPEIVADGEWVAIIV